MRRFIAPGTLAPGHLALGTAICAAALVASTSFATEAGEPLYVRHVMQAEVNPAIVAIWDVGNNAMGEDGGIDPALMTEEMWTALGGAATALVATADKMAAANDIRAAAPGNMATEDYEVSMADIQTYIDADRQGFRDEAGAFATLARRLETAVSERDIATAGEIVSNMDTECATCHARYWYAEAQ